MYKFTGRVSNELHAFGMLIKEPWQQLFMNMIHRLPVVRQNCLTCSRPDMHISLLLDVKQRRGVHY